MTIAKFKMSAIVAGTLTGVLSLQPTQAIERSDIWVNAVDSSTHAVAWHQSKRKAALAQSLIKPWLQQEVGGELLSEWSGNAEQDVILHVPLGADRFTQGTLKVQGAEHVEVFVNGLAVSAGSDGYELALQTGDHQLLVLVSDVDDWSALDLEWSGKDDHDTLTTSRPDNYRLSATQLYDAATTTQLSLSPNGEYLIWRRQHYSDATGDSAQQQVQLVNVANRQVVFEWTDSGANQFAWGPQSRQLAYLSNGRLQLLDIASAETRQISAELERLGQLRWLNEDTLVFTLMEREDEHDGQVKRYRALEDRWNYFRQSSDIYTLQVDSGVISQVTDLQARMSLQDASTDGERLLVSQSLVDYDAPPHSLTRLVEIDISSGEARDIGEYRTFNRAVYAADGLYVVAGPEFGDHAGRALDDDDLLANNYDGQLYRVSMDGAEVEALSRDFDPSINAIHVTDGNDLVLLTTDRDRGMLYQYRADDERFRRLEQSIEVVDTFSVSQQSTPRIAYAGTSARKPQQTYVKDANDSAQLLWDSADDYYRLNSLSDAREWNFTNERGDTIYGRIYLPHDFDERESYPALVYYYGGTSPVSRNFTGRYPFNLWADMGYVVYVLQPTGTFGFGQEFSARHVNAWGEYTTDDIIEGTRRFIDEHDFVDGDRVGNMGASYGGFMTMLLATKTDMFAASMSHAGISHISSYWGHGWWGFGYSGEASKGSFPWNAPELYRERSPLNFADQINTPMLLIHGDADTNVPPGESHMMYTALKMLGKDVELVEFVGEDHAINRRTPRLLWWQTYMAFFDKHLKDEPQWWDYLYEDR
ncbi:MAG: S9 family peptidase [Idiomarina sp.]|nr:S9 family peptidase [Idiomarina sp.]